MFLWRYNALGLPARGRGGGHDGACKLRLAQVVTTQFSVVALARFFVMAQPDWTDGYVSTGARLSLLGTGADSSVHRAVCKSSGEWHALKFLDDAAYTATEVTVLNGLRVSFVSMDHVLLLLATAAPQRKRPRPTGTAAPQGRRPRPIAAAPHDRRPRPIATAAP
jgi:hypothetical protein